MAIEWDDNKNKINIEKHGIDFFDAHKIFRSPIITKVDDRTDYQEKRWIGIGARIKHQIYEYEDYRYFRWW